MVVAIDPIKKKEYVVVNDKDKLERLYKEYKKDIWVGFNCRNYDQYILKGILCDFNPKTINDWIIVKKKKGWEYSSLFNKIPLILYDTMPNPPVSLKTLEGFMGLSIHETSVDFNINRKLTEQEIKETIKYCRFDVLNTIEVFMRRRSEFDAQMDLLKAFNLPLQYLGKTQAQLAAVILDGKKVRFNDDWDIRLPNNVQLGKYSEVINWFLDKNNHFDTAELKLNIDGLEHTIAWGGIHAGIPKETITCNEDEVIFDIDVGQLYPNLMKHYNLWSRAARKPEMGVFVLDTSMELKAQGKKKEREPYKRQCNIFYGAMGDPFNPLYDPLHRKLVCVFGQVFLIDLIDKIEDIVSMINSNTDGLFFKIKKSLIPELKRRVGEWEKRTKLVMEYDEYSKFISKDVNNYLAVKVNGGIHAKGAYVKDLNDLDFDLPIVNEALRKYMISDIPVEVTVNSCTEFRKFQKIVKLSNKYEWVEHENGHTNTKLVNKAYRTFASRDNSDGRLLKCKTTEKGVKKDKFANTADRCFICNDDIRNMAIPSKLDREWYITKAKERLRDFGVVI